MQNPTEGKLIVKHTFLEFVETPQDQRKRSLTEGAIGDSRLAEDLSLHGVTLENAELERENAELRHASAMQENVRLARENAELRALQEFHGPQQTRQKSAVDQNGMPTHSRDSTPCQAPTISLASCVFTDDDFNRNRTLNGTCLAEIPIERYTTVMLRNLPNMYTREMFIDMLNSEGFAQEYTFVYLPIDFKTHAGLGYAFVDMTSPDEALRLRQHFEGFSQWILASEKRCTVSWSHPDQQGFSAHVERYRNSPVMHKSVPEEWKPVLFSAGERISFPRPNRKIRAPRIRPC
jgi:hypothetical protein|mmetsp:Transcript_83061/g.131055  ORF Transcript_83061/g.131055 Transcript_83061/m.131055 type:complete len:292 (+) Transcript_83061:59-934(+)